MNDRWRTPEHLRAAPLCGGEMNRSNDKPTKRTMDALGKLFAAEIDGLLPFQSKARVFEELCELGLAEPMERTFGAGSRFPVTCRGYCLTTLGNYTYCTNVT